MKSEKKKCSELRLWDQALWCFAFNPQAPVWTSSHACGNAHATTWSCWGGWQLVAWPLFQGLFTHGKGDGSHGLKIRLSDSQSPLRLFPSPVVFISKSSLFFKVMMFPKAMTLRTQYVTHGKPWPTGDRDPQEIVTHRRPVSLMLCAVRVRHTRRSTPELKSCQ